MRLRIEFFLEYPFVCLNRDCSFDGVLSHFAYKKLLREKHPEKDAMKLAVEALPIKKQHFTVDGAKDFFYLASIPILDEIDVFNMVKLSRKTGNLDALLDIAPKELLCKIVSTQEFKAGCAGSNPHREDVVTILPHCTTKVVYVVETTEHDKKALLDLIHDVDRIGKYTKFGFGKVKACSVQETTEPIVKYVPVAAGLPANTDQKSSYRMMPSKPPFWKGRELLCKKALL